MPAMTQKAGCQSLWDTLGQALCPRNVKRKEKVEFIEKKEKGRKEEDIILASSGSWMLARIKRNRKQNRKRLSSFTHL